MKILHIDDSAIWRNIVRETLEQDGYQVISADTAESGLNVLLQYHHHDISVVVTDYDLGIGEMNGAQFAREAKRKRDLPIVLFSTVFTDHLPRDEQALFAYVAPKCSGPNRLKKIVHRIADASKTAKVE
jgi:CheY-like chemotaxis protein